MTLLPDHVHPLDAEGSFRFHCHPGVTCFTECCRELELALSPYDVLRLKQALDLNSCQFFEHYGISEFGPDDLYPKVYLGMVDDGRASCPFVGPAGCRVYTHRPAACRTYPVGRGTFLTPDGIQQERFVMMKEPHCQGFAEDHAQSINEWCREQEIAEYNYFTDLLCALLPRNEDNTFRRLRDDEAALFIDTLYHLEEFRTRQGVPSPLPHDESTLLAYAINWLKQQWSLNQ